MCNLIFIIDLYTHVYIHMYFTFFWVQTHIMSHMDHLYIHADMHILCHFFKKFSPIHLYDNLRVSTIECLTHSLVPQISNAIEEQQSKDHHTQQEMTTSPGSTTQA